MALYGVIGDVHGNAEALAATLTALERYSPDYVLCVGDIVGYNADSDECAAMLQERGVLAIAGNHDLISIRRLGIERCSTNAMHALKQTRRKLQSHTKRYLQSLPTSLEIENKVVLVHGGVRDIQQYMTRPQHIAENVAYLREDFPLRKVCFYGHMHQQKVFEIDASDTIRDLTLGRVINLDSHREYFINPGSVDASRKSVRELAEFAIFDSSALTVEFLTIPYDDAFTEQKASAGGYRMPRWRHYFYSVERRILRRFGESGKGK